MFRFARNLCVLRSAYASVLIATVVSIAGPSEFVNEARGAQASLWVQLQFLDMRFAAIVEQLAVANAPLCRAHMAETGLVVQTLDQFEPALRPQATAAFRFERPISIEVVVVGSPAAKAGVQVNDALVSINGEPLLGTIMLDRATSVTRDTIVQRLEGLPLDQQVWLGLVRNGQPVRVTFVPLEACKVRSEVLTASTKEAQSDDTSLQISAWYLSRYDDREVAVIAAHELAHILLNHTDRLAAAGVHHGVLSMVGNSPRLTRAAEAEADRLSIHLLRNAGYDPASGPSFWLEHGAEISGAPVLGATHGSPRTRAKVMAQEIKTILPDAPAPEIPPLLGNRDRPIEPYGRHP